MVCENNSSKGTINKKQVGPTGGFMSIEAELFYLVLLIAFTLVVDLVLTTTGPRRGRESHV
jgi:hypothetical protein